MRWPIFLTVWTNKVKQQKFPKCNEVFCDRRVALCFRRFRGSKSVVTGRPALGSH
jgi:hypothetical protein